MKKLLIKTCLIIFLFFPISCGFKIIDKTEFNTLVGIDPEYELLPLQRPELFTFTDENSGDSGVNEINKSGQETEIETLLKKYD